MQYYAHFKEDGNVKGFYMDEFHGEDAIPKDAVPITVGEWQEYVANSYLYKLDGSTIRKKTELELAAEHTPAPPTEIDLLKTRQTLIEQALDELLLGGM